MLARSVSVMGWRPRLGSTTREQAVGAATVVVLLVGLWFRCQGYLWSPTALWLDEALWALMLIEGPLSELVLRPLGFLLITKALVNAISASEGVLRFLPWCAAIATLALAPLLARRLFKAPAARLLFVAIVALHPAAIDLAKEFKPYSISLFFHVATMWAVLEYVHSRTAGRLAVVTAVLVPAALFSQDIVFAYPGAFLIAGLAAYRGGRMRHLFVLAATAAATIAVIGGLYVYAWSKIPKSDSNNWGRKYDVFYVAGHSLARSQSEWLLRTYGDSAAIPGLRREELGRERLSAEQRAGYMAVDRTLWIVLHLVGLFTLFQQRRARHAALLVLPLAIWIGFNVLRLWPLGAFRVNVFLVCYMGAIAAAGFDRARFVRAGLRSLAPSLVLLVAPLLALEEGWHREKLFFCHSGDIPKLMEGLASHYGDEPPGELEQVFIDPFSTQMWRYYMEYHPRTRVGLAPRISERFQLRYGAHHQQLATRVRRATVARGSSAWLVFSKEGLYEQASSSWLRKFRVRTEVAGSHRLVQVRRKR